jgi:hypothetical protein
MSFGASEHSLFCEYRRFGRGAELLTGSRFESDFTAQHGFKTHVQQFLAKFRIALGAAADSFPKVARQGHGGFSFYAQTMVTQTVP